ncbi:MAG: 4'-phosphopantetheinyl transferase superfamily protein [Clostridia bacterium]|nr:4'-phosphopantetheinyl transferase superfamily protein [Clostridia bacterium]
MLNKNLVYIADTAPLEDAELFEKLYQSVSSERRAKIDRLRNEREKRLSLGAYVLLKKALSDIGIDSFSLEYGENGKPYLAGNTGVYFSLSHSFERVMCALSDCEIGCDVERVQKKSLAVADRFFAPEEIALIKGAENETDMFSRIWTLKESFLKMTGKGMTIPLDSFYFNVSMDGINVYQYLTKKTPFFKEYSFENDYKYSVCSYNPLFSDARIVIFNQITCKNAHN